MPVLDFEGALSDQKDLVVIRWNFGCMAAFFLLTIGFCNCRESTHEVLADQCVLRLQFTVRITEESTLARQTPDPTGHVGVEGEVSVP